MQLTIILYTLYVILYSYLKASSTFLYEYSITVIYRARLSVDDILFVNGNYIIGMPKTFEANLDFLPLR